MAAATLNLPFSFSINENLSHCLIDTCQCDNSNATCNISSCTHHLNFHYIRSRPTTHPSSICYASQSLFYLSYLSSYYFFPFSQTLQAT